MKIGDSVKVKSGIMDPDYEKYDMSGWQGRIIHIEKDSNIIEIEWDSVTLQQLPKDYIEASVEEGCEYTLMNLEVSEVELAQPRDTEAEVERITDELDEKFDHIDYDPNEENITNILGGNDLSVTMENLKKYYDFLIKNIQFPCILTGSQDFPWEEPYVLGGWNKKEYERLKKDNASYTDKFELIEFEKEIEDGSGIFVKVKRISDKKIFTLPLWDLESIDRKTNNFQLISDYSSWMTNYQ